MLYVSTTVQQHFSFNSLTTFPRRRGQFYAVLQTVFSKYAALDLPPAPPTKGATETDELEDRKEGQECLTRARLNEFAKSTNGKRESLQRGRFGSRPCADMQLCFPTAMDDATFVGELCSFAVILQAEIR